MVKKSTSELRCRVPNYFQVTSDNNNKMFIDIHFMVIQKYWEWLHKLRLSIMCLMIM